MLVHFKKVFRLTSIGYSFERRAYLFVLKATRVFPIPTQAEQAEDGKHFTNGYY